MYCTEDCCKEDGKEKRPRRKKLPRPKGNFRKMPKDANRSDTDARSEDCNATDHREPCSSAAASACTVLIPSSVAAVGSEEEEGCASAEAQWEIWKSMQLEGYTNWAENKHKSIKEEVMRQERQAMREWYQWEVEEEEKRKTLEDAQNIGKGSGRCPGRRPKDKERSRRQKYQGRCSTWHGEYPQHHRA